MPPSAPSGERAFTMVEVAIALAIIGFALVAIIGVLPSGLSVQKENREETIINQEATLWMNAIRSGAQGMDYLTNYVDGIQITRTPLDANGQPTTPVIYEYYTDEHTSLGDNLILTNGFRIVGLLTTPKYETNVNGQIYRNEVTAYVRAVSGNATDKAPQDNATVRDSAFSYRLMVEVLPFTALDDHRVLREGADNYDAHTYFNDYWNSTHGSGDPHRDFVRGLTHNLSDVRLYFRWPLHPPLDAQFSPSVATNAGSSRQIYRTMVGGIVTNVQDQYIASDPLYHFQRSGTYARPQ